VRSPGKIRLQYAGVANLFGEDSLIGLTPLPQDCHTTNHHEPRTKCGSTEQHILGVDDLFQKHLVFWKEFMHVTPEDGGIPNHLCTNMVVKNSWSINPVLWCHTGTGK